MHRTALMIGIGLVLSTSSGCMGGYTSALVKPEAGCPVALAELEENHPIRQGTAATDLEARLTAKSSITANCRDFNVAVAQNNEGVARSSQADVATKTAWVDWTVDKIDHLARDTAAIMTGYGAAVALPDAIRDQSDQMVVSGGNASAIADSNAGSVSNSAVTTNVSSPPPGHGGHNPRPEPPRKQY